MQPHLSLAARRFSPIWFHPCVASTSHHAGKLHIPFTPPLTLTGYGSLSSNQSSTALFARKKGGFAELLAGGGKLAPSPVKREKLRPGVVSPPLPVPPHIPRPSYADSGEPPAWSEEPQIHNEEGMKKMEAACQLAAQVLQKAGELVKPGITTNEIDVAVHQWIIDAGAYPSPLNYGKFPKSVCTSVNECICHGIPDSTTLKDGDIINIDVTVFLNGYHGDTSRTFFCGNVDDAARDLVRITEESLKAAIAICAPGVEYRKVGQTIHALADKHGYGVVRKFVGHGVGQTFHSGPTIAHCRNSYPGRMIKNQTFTIEPMLSIGNPREVVWDDNWTAVTADGSLTAQFEHTIVITDDGARILTLP